MLGCYDVCVSRIYSLNVKHFGDINNTVENCFTSYILNLNLNNTITNDT